MPSLPYFGHSPRSLPLKEKYSTYFFSSAFRVNHLTNRSRWRKNETFLDQRHGWSWTIFFRVTKESSEQNTKKDASQGWKRFWPQVRRVVDWPRDLRTWEVIYGMVPFASRGSQIVRRYFYIFVWKQISSDFL